MDDGGPGHTDLRDGELLVGRYEIIRTVSAGRRAAVLQGLDRVHDRLVALKVYSVADVDRDALLAEARVLMSMAPHPALPVVRGDFFTEDGSRYVVVMNWVDGVDLQAILDRDGTPGLELRDVIGDLEQVAAALDHLHAHDPSIVHGDVKPANIVRTASGKVVLVDFDIAGAEATRVGTPGFVAPEVAAGEKPGPAADVYGLGATAVTLLDGRPPGTAPPAFAGIDAIQQGDLGRALRSALSHDPERRPRSAGRLVERLRTAGRSDLPVGVVALLASEVVDPSRWWRDEPESMRAAMARLRDLRDDAVARHGGRIVASMNEGDRSIVVFREASSAVVTALELHDAVASASFPPPVEIRLRVAVAVGEAVLSDGAYVGSVVDTVVGLRAAAPPRSTLVPETTAELLVDLVGSEVQIVPLGAAPAAVLPSAARVCAVTRPGAPRPAFDSEAVGVSAAVGAATGDGGGSAATVDRRPGWSASLSVAVQDPVTLAGLVVAGLSLIYLLVLAPELGNGGLALAGVVAGSALTVGWFVHRVVTEERARRATVEQTERERMMSEHGRAERDARAATREKLERELDRLDSPTARDGARALHSLAEQFDVVTDVIGRGVDGSAVTLLADLPSLVDEVYRHGMSALSDVAVLVAVGDGAQHRRVLGELAEVEGRLELDDYQSGRDRARDEQRRASHQQLLQRHDEARQLACDLVLEAERCTAALADAAIALASARAGEVEVDAVHGHLRATIDGVREVQEEMRRLGY